MCFSLNKKIELIIVVSYSSIIILGTGIYAWYHCNEITL